MYYVYIKGYEETAIFWNKEMFFDLLGNIHWCPATNMYFFTFAEGVAPPLISTRSSNGSIEIFTLEKLINVTSILCEFK